jgi:hypothetical protein
MNIRNLPLFAGLVLALGASAAWADGKVSCTTADKSTWKPQADAEAAAKAAGHEVRRSKITDGNCYEVYTVKDGKNLELFYDPVTLKLVKTVVK